MQQHLVFVFGTLKRGFPNHGFNHGTLLLRRSKTEQPYPFFLVGQRHSPWLIDEPGRGLQVHGEVYVVDQDTLEELDFFERVQQPDGYQRKLINVLDQTGQRRQAFAYMKPESQLDHERVMQGPLTAYTADHAMLYSTRSKSIEAVV